VRTSVTMPGRERSGNMRRLKYALQACLAFALLAAPPTTAAAAQTRIGLEPFYFWGRHFEPGNDISGAAPGFFVDLRHHTGRFELKLEGVPAISVHSTTISAIGVPESQSIGILDSDLRLYVDSQQRFFVSVGEALATQTTPFAVSGGVTHTDSRVVGGRYGLGTSLSLSRATFVESQFVLMPALHGVVSYRVPAPFAPLAPRAEAGSNVEFVAAIGTHAGRSECLLGVHSINYAADFTDGTAADQIVSVGVFGEYRYVFGRR